MHRLTQNRAKPETAGLVIHGAARYDLLVWLFTLGRERRLRERILSQAGLQPGEDVLDIGCGTGTLAILAKRQVGEAGAVHGVDAAPEMIARAQTKARRAGVDVAFAEAVVQALPLADQTFDVVLSTLMLHHLPRKDRPRIVREIKRVLRPGGRFLAVDFVKPTAGRKSFMDRFHRHGFVRLDDVVDDLEAAGLPIIRSGPLGDRDLQFVLASNGPPALRAQIAKVDRMADKHRADAHHGHGGLMLAALGVLGVIALIALHAAAGTSLGPFALGSGPLTFIAVAALVLLIIAKLGFLGLVHGFGAKLISRWVGAREE